MILYPLTLDVIARAERGFLMTTFFDLDVFVMNSLVPMAFKAMSELVS